MESEQVITVDLNKGLGLKFRVGFRVRHKNSATSPSQHIDCIYPFDSLKPSVPIDYCSGSVF